MSDEMYSLELSRVSVFDNTDSRISLTYQVDGGTEANGHTIEDLASSSIDALESEQNPERFRVSDAQRRVFYNTKTEKTTYIEPVSGAEMRSFMRALKRSYESREVCE